MITTRVPDYLILIGHAWICIDCRSRLLADPEGMLIGQKLSGSEREHILDLTEESFRTMMDLAAATALSMDDIRLAIDHPRSRLRHFGVRRR